LFKRDEERVLAEHGRWLAKLRDTARSIEQRLLTLERRVAVLETQLVESTRRSNALDLQFAGVGDELVRLGGKVDLLLRGKR